MNPYVAGAIAGATSGLLIAGLGMTYGAGSGRGFFRMPNAIGGMVLGVERGDTREFGSVTLIGVVLHMMLSAAFGICVVLLARLVSGNYALTGAIFGIAIWLVDYYGVGAIHPGSAAVAKLNPVAVGGGLHLIFGIATGLIAVRLMGL